MKNAITRARAVGYWLMVGAVAWVMGLDASGQTRVADAATQAVPSWGQHLDVVQALIVILFGLGVWSVRAKVASIDAKFDLIFRWKDAVSEQLQRLQGEHDVMKGGCHAPRRRREDSSDQ